MICNNCTEEFLIKKSKKGKIDQCDDCSEEIGDIPLFLGFNDGSLNKASNTGIYRGDNPIIRKKIANQKARTGL